eukprot:236905-Pyramimonas_sp.AAC.1
MEMPILDAPSSRGPNRAQETRRQHITIAFLMGPGAPPEPRAAPWSLVGPLPPLQLDANPGCYHE